MRDHISLRVPVEWEGRISSAWVEECLQDYFSRRPLPLLPEDPGADGCRISLSLPRKPVRVLSAALDQPLSTSLRRLIAGYGSELPSSDLRALRAGNPLELESSPVGAGPFPQVQELPPVLDSQRMMRGEGGALFVYERGRWVQKWAPPKEPRLLEMNTNSADAYEQPSVSWDRVAVVILIFGGFFLGIVVWLWHRGSARRTLKALAEPRRFKTWEG